MNDLEVLGATVDGDATRFVVASSVAERVELCLFDTNGDERRRIDLDAGPDGLWRSAVDGVAPGQHYGYRVHGPGDPPRGQACDPAKLLVDPAARRLCGELRWAAELTTPGVDSSPFVPRSVVVATPEPVAASARPSVPWERTVVYEAHVGHLTARHPLVPATDRGRYPGLAAPAVIDHLQRLGVTAVELMPVQHFVSEQALVTEGRRNVWGYNPLAWGSPHAEYATDGGDPVAELRAAVAALHEAGVEVWLDVVFNHTCEGRLGSGPILSWRGFDNAATYRLVTGPEGLVDEDVTGCGNAVDARSPSVRRLIRETLVRWVVEYGIDGFRFDLAATLVRADDGFDDRSPFLADLAAEPGLDGVKLVAEPWDSGPDGYALGRFPAPWREWNDRFRDETRNLWRGQAGSRIVAARLTGSEDAFRSGPQGHRLGGDRVQVGGDGHDGRDVAPGRRGPEATSSINAVATHDGFTLADLVAYDHAVDGGHDQRSWSGGRSGPTADEPVLAGRRRRQRCLLGTIFCAQGVPMLLAGDEIGRTQSGQANGYQLIPAEWGVPWPEADIDLATWVSAATALRREQPALRRPWWTGGDGGAVTWRRLDGREMAEADWSDEPPAIVQAELDGTDLGGSRVLLLLVSGQEGVTFTLPAGRWTVRLDAAWDRPPIHGRQVVTGTLDVAAPGFVALVAPDRPPPT